MLSEPANFGVNQALVEEMFLRWSENPQAVSESWRRYFVSLNGNAARLHGNASDQGAANGLQPTAASIANTFAAASEQSASRTTWFPPSSEMLAATELQGRVSAMINAYRVRGHLFAQLDPLQLLKPPADELALERFGLGNVDPETVFSSIDMAGPSALPLHEIVRRMRDTYCRSIGVEFHFLESAEQRRWLQDRMESTCNHIELSQADQLRILAKLTDAEIFESFLHTNYTGAKRFSLEGAESFIPLLDLCIERTAALGAEEVVIGMAHRGRLNVLANIMGMQLREIFAAFQDDMPERKLGRGDVKYHLGYSFDRSTQSGQNVHLTLSFNPSHLEFVNAVVEGRVRAKQDRRDDAERHKVLPILVHGDAAFMGQGIVAETLNLGRLEGYRVGGTIHVVINNQVGFTTVPDDTRSTRYCTDITRMLGCPVLHVNGEDPEAVAQVVQLAAEYRQTFHEDIVIDLYCYRKYGHNEADEPRFTQPVVYAAVDKKRTVRQVYIERLANAGKVTAEQAEQVWQERKQQLEAALKEARGEQYALEPASMHGVWEKYRGGPDLETPDEETGVARQELNAIIESITRVPSGFAINPKIEKLFEQRRERVLAGDGIDWGTAEWLAYGSLLQQGSKIRLTGQDTRRGTFSHRHAVVYDTRTSNRHCGLTELARTVGQQASFEIYDSPLSEAGVLGFEYGYSLDTPDALVLWEAQFGDFANGAQVIIDQFISSSEDKWHRLSGVVLLLPHAFEGQGPEHSSARLERFLNLCAEDNLQVCNLSTPAQFFHCLRRQVVRPWRKPLVIMTPKSLLRHPRATSQVDELVKGSFQRLIGDAAGPKPAKTRRVILCSGKVYYDLLAAREANKVQDVALLRLEQIYPLRADELRAALKPYPAKAEIVWVQEEPWNMGAWYYIHANLPSHIDRSIRCVSRTQSASPATGSHEAHKLEQAKLVEEALG